jgi:hypothetical protein
MTTMPTCRHCNDVIGVYEPMVVVIDGQAHTTSRAAEQVSDRAGERYHRDCHARMRRDGQLEDEAPVPRNSTT